jgi:TolB protein
MTVVINADGSNPRPIIATKMAQSGYNRHAAAWSPDGNTIAFTKDGDVFTVRLDGSSPLRLTVGERVAEPEWSPDGSRIAVQDGNGGVAIVSVGNSAITRLDQANADMTPDWSPDGASIVFASRRNGLVHIYIMKSDGTGVVDLMPRQLSDNYRPRWNPTAR